MGQDISLKIAIGALLHDIGKVIYRQGDDARKHSISGHDYLKDSVGISDRDILDSVRYHHSEALKGAEIPTDSATYIVYMADNIASAADRRPSETYEAGFDIHTPLSPVFNILNRNNSQAYYAPYILHESEGINYPVEEKRDFEKRDYDRIMREISDHLRGIEWDSEYVQSLLEILEADLSYIPSATSKKELPDISLYDHLKMTAAYGLCIYYYLKEKGQGDYREVLFKNSAEFYQKEVFMLASLDVSGIQDFIYTISTKDALKTLRASVASQSFL